MVRTKDKPMHKDEIAKRHAKAAEHNKQHEEEKKRIRSGKFDDEEAEAPTQADIPSPPPPADEDKSAKLDKPKHRKCGERYIIAKIRKEHKRLNAEHAKPTIASAPIERIIRWMTRRSNPLDGKVIRWSPEALSIAHAAVEDYIGDIFYRANIAAMHAGRLSIRRRDFKAIAAILAIKDPILESCVARYEESHPIPVRPSSPPPPPPPPKPKKHKKHAHHQMSLDISLPERNSLATNVAPMEYDV